MTDRNPTALTLDELIADLDASDAEIAAGLTVPGEVVAAKLRATLERMKAAQTTAPKRGGARSR
jgi:hypothetical protein